MQAFHTVKHNFSINAMRCTNSIIPILFDDSSSASRFASSSTKTTVLIKNVLHPFVKDQWLSTIGNSNFSIDFDSTPIRNNRVYGITIRYKLKKNLLLLHIDYLLLNLVIMMELK